MKVQTHRSTAPQEQENQGEEDEGESPAEVSTEDANITACAAGDISSPMRQFGNQQRSFNKSWMDYYSWLEYSVAKDAAFCFACRHFLK